jgi:cell division transport system permease protein
MARRKEIEIMQLVGATTSWIYLPFILQGIAFGLLGAAIAWILITTVEQFFTNLLATGPDFIQYLARGAQPSPLQALLLPLLLLSLGGSVGLIGSLFAVRRFASR